MKLLSDDELERSAVVANCRMNRERDLTGSSGYSKEIGYNPLDVLRERIIPGRPVAWLTMESLFPLHRFFRCRRFRHET